MAKVNLSKLSKAELRALAKEIEATEAARMEEDLNATRAKVHKVIDASGFTINQVLGKMGGRKTGPVKPKYRNPKNASETWTGRGRRPRWLEAQLKSGKTVESFLIK